MFTSQSPTSRSIPLRLAEAAVVANGNWSDSVEDLLHFAPAGTAARFDRPAPGEAILGPGGTLVAWRHDLLAVGGFNESIGDPAAAVADLAARLAGDGVRVRGLVGPSAPSRLPFRSSIAPPPRSHPGPKRSVVDAEHAEIRRFLAEGGPGSFLEIGANEPVVLSQTWHLARVGWRGVLVEPNPRLAARLRTERPDATVIEAICSGPSAPTSMRLRLPESSGHATVMATFADRNDREVETFEVPTRTADSIIERELGGRVDFVSIDVEGHEPEVLRGLSLERFRPRLMLVEDDMSSLETTRLLWAKGYRMLRRTQNNNWWIPQEVPHRMWPRERWRMLGKFLRWPYRAARRRLNPS